MDNYFISGVQQVGIGVKNVAEAWAWYRKIFGMDIPIFQDAGPAPYMTRYTGGTVHERAATLALNLLGGSGFEIWQFTSRTPQPPARQPELGDYGIFAGIIKTPDVKAAHAGMARVQENAQGGAGAATITPLGHDPQGDPVFHLRDPFGNWFKVTESTDWFKKPPAVGKKGAAEGTASVPGNGVPGSGVPGNGVPGGVIPGGPCGAVIGVSDIGKALPLYRDLLGYDEMLYDASGAFEDVRGLPGGAENARRVLLTHRLPRKGAFSSILGKSYIELVQTDTQPRQKIFDGRFWGDLGYIHLCFDINGMAALRIKCEEAGFPFTVDSKDSFDMGEASGHFTYIEDPDGTLIEFVETYKMPISKKRGWYLNLKKRNQEKALPKWMLKTLKFNRIKD